MARYLYIFGFRRPEPAADALSSSAEEESSEALFIDAASPEEALAWGREVSETFFTLLFPEKGLSWKALGFTHWLETDPRLEYPADTLAKLPVVGCGSYPDFTRWLPQPETR